MTDPLVRDPRQSLEPVHPVEEEAHADRWSKRLVIYLRVMATFSMLKGLYHWAIVCGFDGLTHLGFDAYSTAYQASTVFFAVFDLVAAVGLWLAAPWGAVVWLTSVISMTAVEVLFPQIYGGRVWVIAIDALLIFSYLGLALMAAREHPQ